MLSIKLLNPLRRGTPESMELLRQSIRDHLGCSDPEETSTFLVSLIAKTREHTVEKCRTRLIEVFDEEAWRAALRWWTARHSATVPPMVCNMMLASALTSLTVVDTLRSDGEETVHAVDMDAQGFAHPVWLDAPTGLACN